MCDAEAKGARPYHWQHGRRLEHQRAAKQWPRVGK